MYLEMDRLERFGHDGHIYHTKGCGRKQGCKFQCPDSHYNERFASVQKYTAGRPLVLAERGIFLRVRACGETG